MHSTRRQIRVFTEDDLITCSTRLRVVRAGTHEWTWDGRSQSGKRVIDQRYVIRVYDGVPGRGSVRASKKVQVDTSLEVVLRAPTYGDELGAPARVFPRTTVLTDSLDLAAATTEKKLTSLELVIRNSRGGVVRRADVAEPVLSVTTGDVLGHGRTVAWAAVRGGRPLPSGRYTAVVHVVDSALFAGGLSYRSAECTASSGSLETQPMVAATHMLEVPEATGVRGLAAVRVAFTGAPTVEGEPDLGKLGVYGAPVPGAASVVAGTSGQSAWVEEPRWGEGLAENLLDGEPQRDPAALWGFGTVGTDSVDVASFTVDVRE